VAARPALVRIRALGVDITFMTTLYKWQERSTKNRHLLDELAGVFYGFSERNDRGRVAIVTATGRRRSRFTRNEDGVKSLITNNPAK
jgi:hypothetical protein